MFVDQSNTGGQGQRKCGVCKQTGISIVLICITIEELNNNFLVFNIFYEQ